MIRDGLERRSFAREGLRLAWYDAGGLGLPVVFQHGLTGDVAQTAEAFPTDPRFRMITLECRGHGASETGEELSIATFADDVAALIDAEIGAPVVLGGVSMGAALALRLAVRRPDLALGLALVRPAWVTAPGPENMDPNAEVGRLLADLPPDAARAAFAGGQTARDLAVRSPDNLASLLGLFARPAPATTARLLLAIAADGPGVSADDLRRLAPRTLICATGADAIHPLAHARSLAALIPGAHLVELTPKGHDRPAHFAQLHAALSAFLEELSHVPT